MNNVRLEHHPTEGFWRFLTIPHCSTGTTFLFSTSKQRPAPIPQLIKIESLQMMFLKCIGGDTLTVVGLAAQAMTLTDSDPDQVRAL